MSSACHIPLFSHSPHYVSEGYSGSKIPWTSKCLVRFKNKGSNITQLFSSVILPAALSVEDMWEQDHEERNWGWSSNFCLTLEKGNNTSEENI